MFDIHRKSQSSEVGLRNQHNAEIGSKSPLESYMNISENVEIDKERGQVFSSSNQSRRKIIMKRNNKDFPEDFFHLKNERSQKFLAYRNNQNFSSIIKNNNILSELKRCQTQGEESSGSFPDSFINKLIQESTINNQQFQRKTFDTQIINQIVVTTKTNKPAYFNQYNSQQYYPSNPSSLFQTPKFTEDNNRTILSCQKKNVYSNNSDPDTFLYNQKSQTEKQIESEGLKAKESELNIDKLNFKKKNNFISGGEYDSTFNTQTKSDIKGYSNKYIDPNSSQAFRRIQSLSNYEISKQKIDQSAQKIQLWTEKLHFNAKSNHKLLQIQSDQKFIVKTEEDERQENQQFIGHKPKLVKTNKNSPVKSYNHNHNNGNNISNNSNYSLPSINSLRPHSHVVNTSVFQDNPSQPNNRLFFNLQNSGTSFSNQKEQIELINDQIVIIDESGGLKKSEIIDTTRLQQQNAPNNQKDQISNHLIRSFSDKQWIKATQQDFDNKPSQNLIVNHQQKVNNNSSQKRIQNENFSFIQERNQNSSNSMNNLLANHTQERLSESLKQRNTESSTNNRAALNTIEKQNLNQYQYAGANSDQLSNPINLTRNNKFSQVNTNNSSSSINNNNISGVTAGGTSSSSSQNLNSYYPKNFDNQQINSDLKNQIPSRFDMLNEIIQSQNLNHPFNLQNVNI